MHSIQTNSTIVLFEETRSWDGEIVLSAAGTIEAWNEIKTREERLNRSRSFGGQLDESEIERGYFITTNDIDYTPYQVSIDGSTFTVIGQDRHVMRKRPGDEAGRYHHTEVFYR